MSGSTIVRCDCAHYRVPREIWAGAKRVGASGYEISHFELITVEVESAEGATGNGFTYTVGHGGVAVHALLEAEIAPALLGEDCEERTRLWHTFTERLHFVGTGGVTAVAVAAVDIALWDLAARSREIPLVRLLGQQRQEIPAYASGVNLAYSLEELLAQMRDFRSAGFSALKMKVGRTLAEDVARVQAVREAIGADCELMVDANMGWTLPEAARRARALEPFELSWLEEPLRPDDVEGHAALQRQTTVPLAAGETLFTPAAFAPYLQAQAIRIPQPDVIRLGVTGWLQVAALSLAHGLPLAPHFIPEIHVHLACAVPHATTIEYLPLFERLLERPLAVDDGVARPPDRPGHGMAFALDVIEPYRVDAPRGSSVGASL